MLKSVDISTTFAAYSCSPSSISARFNNTDAQGAQASITIDALIE